MSANNRGASQEVNTLAKINPDKASFRNAIAINYASKTTKRDIL
jgi:hypothetical protein